MEQIISQMGVHQGDPLAPLGFALAIHPLLERISDLSRGGEGGGFTKGYLDDLSLACCSQSILQILEIIMEEGPALGISINFDKSKLLLGKRETFEEAQRWAKIYFAMGFKPANVVLNPDNIPSSWEPEETTQMTRRYGVTCLGTPIGSDCFIKEWLVRKDEELRGIQQNLILSKSTKQSKMLMLRYCFSQKVNYLCRTVNPEFMTSFLQNFDRMKLEVVASIAECEEEDFAPFQSIQCLMHLRDGGLGLHLSHRSKESAYVASVVVCLPGLCELFPHFREGLRKDWLQQQSSEDVDETFMAWHESFKDDEGLFVDDDANPFLVCFVNSIFRVAQSYQESASLPPIYEILIRGVNPDKLQSRLFKPVRKLIYQELLSAATLNKDKHRIRSARGHGDDAGAWLEVGPRNWHSTIKCADFKVALRYRLGFDFPELVRSTQVHKDNAHHQCPFKKCGEHFDDDAHHFMEDCKCGGRTRTHNAIRDELVVMIRDAHIAVRKEVNFKGIKEKDGTLVGYRADILMMNGSQDEIIEVSLTNPCCASNIVSPMEVEDHNGGIKESRQSAEKREYAKLKKYRENGCTKKVIPFIVEVFGRIGPAGIAFIDKIASQSHDWKYATSKFRSFWLGRISCALVRSLGSSYRQALDLYLGTCSEGEIHKSYNLHEQFSEINFMRKGGGGGRGKLED
jgi:hypothetical protein